jgi:pilus assembly protein CpaE
MITSPISIIIVGKDQQERSTARSQLLASGKVHVVAESSEYSRGMELVEQFNPQSALILLNGSEQPLELVKSISEKYPGTAVVCTGTNCASNIIVKAYRSGATEFLVQPLKQEELEEVLSKIDAMQAQSDTSNRTGQVVAIYSGRGGSGSTTLAVNLAAAMVKCLKKETVLVDLNLQYGTVPLFFGVDPEYTIADVARNQDRLDTQLLKSFLVRTADDLYCLPAPLKVEEADDVQSSHLQRLFSMLRTMFPYTVVDLGHQLDTNTVTVLDLADTILLVSLLDVPSVYSTKRVLDVFGRMGYPGGKIRVIVNRYDRGSDIPLEKVEQVFQTPIETVFSEDNRSTTASINLGNPLILSQPKSPLIKQYTKLVWSVSGITEENGQNGSGSLKKGLFESLLGKK